MRRIAIFSPAAGGNVGHGFIYALKICTYLKEKNHIKLFTIDDPKKTSEFLASGIDVILSMRFGSGRIDKKRFNRLGFLKNIVYGIYRIYYNYILLKEYYRRLDHCDVYHLLEFEYAALYIYSLFHYRHLKKSILGLHIADFKWIPGRPWSVNIYKSLLKGPVSWMLKNCRHTTSHGESVRSMLIQDFSLDPDTISSLQYGCEVRPPEITKKEARKVIGLSDEKRDIALFFGVFRSDKGLLEVIQHFDRIHKDIVLLIAGSEGNITYSKVEEVIIKSDMSNRIHTRFKYFDEDEIKYYYYAADFILIPHKGDHLAFSGPLSLAVEYCRPVVASNVGEIGPFVTHNKLGMTFSADDWDDFIETTNRLHRQLSKYEESHFLQVQIKNSWDEMGRKIETLYKN